MNEVLSAAPSPASSSAPKRSLHFRSPEGFLTDVYLTNPSYAFDPRGVFTVGVHLTRSELFGIEKQFRALFAMAFPDEIRAPTMPFRDRSDGTRTLSGKSGSRPDILDASRRHLIHVHAGSRARLIGSALAYRFDARCGVSLFVNTVEVVTLEARDPRRERKRLEQEALRQAAARVRSGMR